MRIELTTLGLRDLRAGNGAITAVARQANHSVSGDFSAGQQTPKTSPARNEEIDNFLFFGPLLAASGRKPVTLAGFEPAAFGKTFCTVNP